MKYFETQFLEEAEKFIAKLDRKTISKVFYTIDIAEQTNDPKLLKNYRMIFGSLEQNLSEFKLDCWHFGIKQTIKTPWFCNSRIRKKG